MVTSRQSVALRKEKARVRLNSWKEIAGHLQVSVRTVQRWERQLGLPIHRRMGNKRDAVYAYADELERWWDELERKSSRRAAAGRRRPAIAVLPFLNINGDEEGEFFCEGITEELINAFTKVQGLAVAPRSAVTQFKEREVPARDIGRRLGVTAVLEGSVRRAEKRLRISVELVDASSGFTVWSERWDTVMQDIFGIQDQIAQGIVEALRLRIAPVAQVPPIRRTRSIEAYQAYVKGRFWWNKRTAESIRKAGQCFQQSLRQDPDYAPALAGMADFHALSAAFGVRDPREAMKDAKQAAVAALRADETLAAAHSSHAFVLAVHEYEWNAAEMELLRAIQLDPADPLPHTWLCWIVYAPAGRFWDAARHAQQASLLDPVTMLHNMGLGMIRFFQGRHREAIRELSKVEELDPNHTTFNTTLAQALTEEGDFSGALEACRRIQSPVLRDGFLGYVLGKKQERGEAKRLLKRLNNVSGSRYVPALMRSIIHIGLGQREEALGELENAFEQRDSMLIWLAHTPLYNPLRREEGFSKLVEKLRLPV